MSERQAPNSAESNFYEIKQVTLDDQVPTREGVSTGYPFWSVECIYSKDPPPPDSLTETFVRFLGTEVAAEVIDGANYFACASHSDDRIAQLCRDG